MRVLHGMTNLDEQLQPLVHGQIVRVTIVSNGDTADQFHYEVRTPRVGGPGIEHAGDVRVVHQGQSLPFGLEAGNDLPGIHSRLDNLERDPAVDRRLLFRHVHHTHSTFANLFEQLVRANERARPLGWRQVRCKVDCAGKVCRRRIKQAVRSVVCHEQRFEACAKRDVAGSGLVRYAIRSASGIATAVEKISLT
jgi:hypothetical protein